MNDAGPAAGSDLHCFACGVIRFSVILMAAGPRHWLDESDHLAIVSKSTQGTPTYEACALIELLY